MPSIRKMTNNMTSSKNRPKKCKVEKSRSIITSVFQAVTGTRHKNRRRQVTGIPPTPMTMGISSPIVCTDAPALTMPPAPVETELKPPTMPESVLPMQLPTTESQLGASYIDNHSQQVAHNNTNISVCSSDSDAQENLKSLFDKRLNDKIYTIFKELFSNTNIYTVHKILPKLVCTIMK